MPGSGPKNYPCTLCKKRTKPDERRPVNKDTRKILRKCFMIDCADGVLCRKCRHKCGNLKPTSSRTEKSCATHIQSPVGKSTVVSMKSPPSVTLPLQSTANTHAYCVLCRRPGPKLVVVPAQTRFTFFLEQNILISSGARCCPVHIVNDTINTESIENLVPPKDTSFVNRTTIMELVEQLREEALQRGSKRIDFDDPSSLSDRDYLTLTGLRKCDFDDLLLHVQSADVRPSKTRTVRTCLAIFLTKMKTAMDNNMLGVLFNMSKPQIRRAVSSIRQVLSNKFVPNHLGFKHITRDAVISEHTRPLAKELFSPTFNQAILVLDGTYIYVQKSSQFSFQRRSYSMHKQRHLLKPMMIVTTTGYIVSAIGPYLADGKNSDAKILNHIIGTDTEEIKTWLQEDDILIVDRGFRDSAGVLADLGIQMEMPSFLQKGHKQHKTEDANSSRLITKIRWVVESVNARIKTWRYLARQLPNSQIPYVGEYVRIISALCNKYRPPLSSGDEENDLQTAAKMRHLSTQTNLLQTEVESNNLQKKRYVWRKIDDENIDIPDFPQYTEEEIRELTLGVYQVKLAKHYTQEHMSQEGYELWVDHHQPGLLAVKIQSRHTSSKSYLCWIRFEEGAVTSWYCCCKSGARVVGTCAHIASVIWYLSFARHSRVNLELSKNWLDSVCDAAIIPEVAEVVDESDSESEAMEE